MQISGVSMQAGTGWLLKAVVTYKPVANRLNVCLHQCLQVSWRLNTLHTTSRHVAASLLYQRSKGGRYHQPVLLVFHSVWGGFTTGGGCRYRFVYVCAYSANCSFTTALSWTTKGMGLSQFNGTRHKRGACKLFLHFRCREIFSGFWPALLLFCMMLCFDNNAS